ncbi:exodeoxyribonuclease III [uncultured Corynebacterium sp.]|uniref:exodeoxyribonuclease III n=1 Tax=uncultured Corynebacterium sp. TaxID=159447 RepID=UPI0025D721DB|nr:exodeoxyribonuclease III [uncultured Corynebacterium sp.]
MRIATWNINSVRIRAGRALDLLHKHDLDVLCLQETKVADGKFPVDAFPGYHVTHHGLNQWNGVAIVSKEEPSEVYVGFPGQPGFHKDPAKPQEREARALGAVIRGVEIWSLYIPNGRELTDPHYLYKLEFDYALARYAETRALGKLLLAGDFNVAPEDADVWDIEAFRGKTHVSEPERAAFEMILEAGLRPLEHAEPYTYFDYKGARFQRGQGMKIDFLLASAQLRALRTFVDLEERAGEKTSDHAPLITELDLPDFGSVR